MTTSSTINDVVDHAIEKFNKQIVIAVPLGLGKPVELLNAFYLRASQDPTISLHILTALSLEVPSPAAGLEQKLLAPFVERVFDQVPQLLYAKALKENSLPENVIISEFFFNPGSQLFNQHAQRHYISTNYTHAARDVFEQGVNVAAQMVAPPETGQDSEQYSLSCNPDTSLELLRYLDENQSDYISIAQVNRQLPFMSHDAVVNKHDFDFIIDDEAYYKPLFSTPKMPVSTNAFYIGLYASRLLKDGGTLQVGIGTLGDAVTYATLLRHQEQETYHNLINDLALDYGNEQLIGKLGGTGPFSKGLYGSTEMLVDTFQPLYEANILKRKVYDFWALQQLINHNEVDEDALDDTLLQRINALGVDFLREKDFSRLQWHGVFSPECGYDNGYIVAPNDEKILANLNDPNVREQLNQLCLGTALRNGIIAHGGFFLGCNRFYQFLRDLPAEERAQFCMTGVEKVNQLDANPRLYKQQRIDARFLNTCIKVNLLGAVTSDGLDNGQVISGVGGQYNFVAMAHQLLGGRSIIMLNSVRESKGETESNIVMNYGYCTIPRHLRDIVITEYGIANLRGKSDEDVIKALLNIADSRFQSTLLEAAQATGKLAKDYNIPEAYRNNTPERLAQQLQAFQEKGFFPAFPFGSDFTEQEEHLVQALQAMQTTAYKTAKWKLASKAFMPALTPKAAKPYLQRLGLDKPNGIEEKVSRRLLIDELKKQQFI